MIYSVLGFVSMALMAVLVAPYVLRIANKHLFKNNKSIASLVRFFKKIHKPAGFALLFAALLHGYLIMGRISLHTGTVLYATVILAAIFGILFYKKKKKIWLQLHKICAAVSVILLALHFFAPAALYYLFK